MKIEAPCNPGGLALDQVLESAVVMNWNALVAGAPEGLVKVEYHVGPDGALEDLRLWALTRDYWTLICEYSLRAGWADGPRFLNGFHSRPLSRLLQSIMLNQVLFQNQCIPNTNGTIEVRTPTPEDTMHATLRVNEMFPAPVQSTKRPVASLAAEVAS
jgi:hypothetical protein